MYSEITIRKECELEGTETRSDRIYQILAGAQNNRMKVAEVRDHLAALEEAPDLHVSIVSGTARQDNKTRRAGGKSVRFNVFNDGDEQFGNISITPAVKAANTLEGIVENYVDQTPAIIQAANDKVRNELRKQISKLSWQEFEDNFLTRILESLGFSDIQVTQRTRDGGADAFCTYRRGVVRSMAIVSAKHWKGKAVPDNEVDRVRGIAHQADTAVIVTSSKFSGPAKEKAKPAPGWRSVVLIDGDFIVDTCLQNSIGVEEVSLPKLYRNTDLKADTEAYENT